ncbi:unnamed protein product [Discula destructiva]
MSSGKPIFMATHPRACSTAFERVFMTRRDILQTAHEPFGDAFYYGPERLSKRFENDEDARIKSGFAESTYRTVMDRLEHDGQQDGKRVFIKDIAHYLLPPNGESADVAESLLGGHPLTDGESSDDDSHSNHNGAVSNHTTGHVNGPTMAVDEDENPTVMPTDMLRGFHWTFLIRHPRRSIPSYYRCTIPPLSDLTGFTEFMPSEAGYDELRRLFDYLLAQDIIGPAKAGSSVPVDEALNDGSGSESGDDAAPRRHAAITVIDADDLLQHPEAILKIYCKEVGIDYTPAMLEWGDDENQTFAAKAFEKWYGFHHDAIDSKCLKPRAHGAKNPSKEEEDAEWRNKFGDEAARVIRSTVDENTADYEYLKSFAIKV